MAISVKCSACGHGYRAADQLAGRRVRCKHCGDTFRVPAEAVDAPPPFGRPGEIDLAPAAGRHAGLAASPPEADPAAETLASSRSAAAEQPVYVAAPHGRDEDAFAAQPTPGDVFGESFQNFETARGNKPFVFPGSQVLDQWLPLFLVVMLVTWLAYQVLGAGPPEPGWVKAVRLFVLLAAYAGIVFPACLASVRMAAQTLNSQPPPGTRWRTFATFLLPATIGCVAWLSSGGVVGLIVSALLAILVMMPVMWLLFRIQPDDAAVSLGYSAAGFGVGMVAAALLMGVLNLILLAVMWGAGARHTLAMSPFGPGFLWDAPTVEKPLPPPPRAKPKDVDPTDAEPADAGPTDAEPADPAAGMSPAPAEHKSGVARPGQSVRRAGPKAAATARKSARTQPTSGSVAQVDGDPAPRNMSRRPPAATRRSERDPPRSAAQREGR